MQYNQSTTNDYIYQFTKKLETFKTNDKLGYRTAGSEAEYLTGQMIAEEMRNLGLSEVTQDAFTLDTWDFKKAELTFTTVTGESHTAILGSYQTHFVTDGPTTFDIVYAGRGTAYNFESLDVTNKLVVIDIDQEQDWWISYPAMQAHVKGAAAIIAVQMGGFSEVHPDALNAQDICGPANAPAFSMSQSDSQLLRQRFAKETTFSVTFDAVSIVKPQSKSYNYHGRIKGIEKDSFILLSAHYDSYFSGFQDDHAAIALMLGIAKDLLAQGVQPQKTIIFLALAAEEWGVIDSRYDWSVGAYNQIFHVRPEWRGKVFANINFELPAVAHMKKHRIRCVYELTSFLQQFAQSMPPHKAYPNGIEIVAPLATTSDDFSFAIGGIPALRNDFQDSPFIRTHYHTQFDDASTFNKDVIDFQLQTYRSLIKHYDTLQVVPLDFTTRLEAMRKTAPASLYEVIDQAITLAKQLPPLTKQHNGKLLDLFYFMETHFTKLTWHDEVIFPHEHALQNIEALQQAIQSLEQNQPEQALLHHLHLIDNNWQAYDFDRTLYDHFTNYVIDAPPNKLLWGTGRIMGHLDLFDVIQSLKTKTAADDTAVEQQMLQQALTQQQKLLQKTVQTMHTQLLQCIKALQQLY